MIKVDFKFDPRAFEKAILQAAAKAIVKRVANARCPEHGKHARIVASGPTTSKLEFKVSACCEKLIKEVKAKLRR